MSKRVERTSPAVQVRLDVRHPASTTGVSVDYDEIYEHLRGRFGTEVVLEHVQSDLTDPKKPIVFDPPQILIRPDTIAEVSAFIRDDDGLQMGSLMCVSSLDRGDVLSVVYHTHSMGLRHRAAMRVDVVRSDPVVPTVEQIWPTANWHEREAHDLMGIVFEGHSDLRTLILPEGWEGHPLRKDYKVQEYYRGMRVPY